MIPEYSLKQIAEMKKAFLASEFGQYAAQEINAIYSRLHGDAETAKTLEERGLLVTKAAGVNEVIDFFARDVGLLDQGYLDKQENKEAGTEQT